jgi:hypothetical protein
VQLKILRKSGLTATKYLISSQDQSIFRHASILLESSLYEILMRRYRTKFEKTFSTAGGLLSLHLLIDFITHAINVMLI